MASAGGSTDCAAEPPRVPSSQSAFVIQTEARGTTGNRAVKCALIDPAEPGLAQPSRGDADLNGSWINGAYHRRPPASVGGTVSVWRLSVPGRRRSVDATYHSGASQYGSAAERECGQRLLGPS